MPANGIWMGLNIIYPKLYPNSLLVSLNSRAALRDGISGVLVTRTYDVEGAQGLSKLDGIVSNPWFVFSRMAELGPIACLY
jgi:hypothetical protein